MKEEISLAGGGDCCTKEEILEFLSPFPFEKKSEQLNDCDYPLSKTTIPTAGRLVNRGAPNLCETLWPFVCKLPSFGATIISTVCLSLIGTSADSEDCEYEMAHRVRTKPCEPLGPVYLLRSVRDQVALFQEKRGITAEENNFVNLIAVMITQAGHAMYAVFTMFLALLPVATMFLHIAHFLLDRTLDLATTRKKPDLMIKSSIFAIQIISMYFAVKFIMTAIFIPIFNMQTNILTKMFFFDDGVNACCS